jgi:DNA-binding transcriptional ArsR family regulator
MVNYRSEPLDRVFAALADPTRRALVARLGGVDSLSVSELKQPFDVSLPAIMKHLGVLAEAGLIVRKKTGRTVACRLIAQPMEEARRWLDQYERFWSAQLDRLEAFLEEEEQCPTSPASPSGVDSTLPPPKSSRPGPTRIRSGAGSGRHRRKSR